MLRGLSGRRAIYRDDVNRNLRQLARRRGKLIGRSVDSPIFERDVLTLDIVQFVQFLTKRLPLGAVVDDADARILCCGGLTRARTPARGRNGSSNQRYDLPAIHHTVLNAGQS